MSAYTELTDEAGVTWLVDSNNNRASVEYFGSLVEAERALSSLEECRDCTNCSGCSGCSDCSRCSGCSGCSDCSRCSDCSGCSDCSDCSGCYLARDKTGEQADGAGWQRPPVPVIENIHQKIFEVASQPCALDMSSWHKCETTHCRAGWVVTYAGEAGKKLEDAVGTLHAACLIYRASDPTWRMSNFFDTNAGAMADMKACAERGFAGHAEARP